MSLNVTLRQLRFLQEVARQGSFTRAGEALYVSQPTVSGAIGELERQAGLPLVESVGRRVQLTHAGKLLCAHGERVLLELSDAEKELAGLKDGQSGRLLVGASSTPGTYLLPAILGVFQASHPMVEISLEITDTQDVLNRVLDGRLDLGVVGEAAFPTALTAETFREETLVLILAPGHPLARREQLTARDLEAQPFVLRERGSSTREVLQRTLERQGIRLRVVMELGNTEAVKKAVAAGLGISLVSEHAVELEARAGELVTRRVPDLDPRRGLFIVHRRGLRLTPLHEQFLAALRSR